MESRAARRRTMHASPPGSQGNGRKKNRRKRTRKKLVGAARFELATTCTPCRYATRLRYAPKREILPLELLENRAQLALNGVDIHAVGARRAAAVAHGGLGLFFLRRRAVEPVARAADGEALLVQELADAADKQHLVVLVVAAIAAALNRLELSELLLPVPQHVRLHPAQIAHFTDGEVALGGDGR